MTIYPYSLQNIIKCKSFPEAWCAVAMQVPITATDITLCLHTTLQHTTTLSRLAAWDIRIWFKRSTELSTHPTTSTTCCCCWYEAWLAARWRSIALHFVTWQTWQRLAERDAEIRMYQIMFLERSIISIYFYQDIKINEKYIILKTFQQEQSDDLFLMYCRGGDPVCSSAIWSSLQLWHQMYFSINIKQFQGKAWTIKRRWVLQMPVFGKECFMPIDYNLFIHILHICSVVNCSFVCLFSFITKLISVCNVCTKITCTALSRTRFNPFKCWLSHSMKLML